MFWIGVAGLLVASVIVTVRISTQKRAPRGKDDPMPRLQRLALIVVALSVAELIFLWLLPLVLVSLATGSGQIGSSLAKLTALSGLVGAIAAYIVRRWGNRLVRVAVAIAIAISGPLFILTPFVGLTYWNTQAWHEGGRARIGPIIVAVSSAIVLALLFVWFDEVTSTAHLFYRERLATAFGGFRTSTVADGDARMRYTQPNWMSPIWLSRETTPFVGREPSMAKLPNLVICAAVNVAEAPVGRLGASFTFETDKSGGPLTGYVPTRWIESRASGGAGTLPGLMAISGAAVAPTMGKMTLPGLRFLMAVFNLRLGVWLPNPSRAPWKLTASELRRGVYPIDLDAEDVTLTRKDNPGGLYVFREALGMNSVRRPFVYVTDGGHWENLGLVELLRRGCGRVVVLDGSGGKNVWFDTLSEAISLARADLGVEIDINLDDLRANDDTGWSHAAFAVGRITFPDGHVGSLVYVRAVIPEDAPAEIKAYAARDRRFPNHPTSDQFFADATFEAYRSLGKHLTQRAVTEGMSEMSDWGRDAPFVVNVGDPISRSS